MSHAHLWLVPLGFFVGAYGTLIGAGGGFLLVPVLLLLAITALAGVVVHLAKGDLATAAWPVLYLVVGVLGGAQLGARLSSRVHGVWIIRGLAIALLLVGLRIVWLALR